jgi:glycosyltransferase involved in cell wall biosynthesis
MRILQVIPFFTPQMGGSAMVAYQLSRHLAQRVHQVSVVTVNEDGFLVIPGNVTDLEEKLNRLLSLPVKQSRAMGQAGRQKVVDHYSWERIGDRLESVYQAVLDNPAAHTQADR